MKSVIEISVPLAALAASLLTAVAAPSLPEIEKKADITPSMIRVATVAQRIECDRHDIQVYEANRLLDLPWFSELAIAIPLEPRARLDSLAGSSVGMIQAGKSRKEWVLYSNMIGMGPSVDFTLAENVFRVKKAIHCTRQRAIELRMDGWVYRLKPGQVLLVLG